jgi:hypothetical protein
MVVVLPERVDQVHRDAAAAGHQLVKLEKNRPAHESQLSTLSFDGGVVLQQHSRSGVRTAGSISTILYFASATCTRRTTVRSDKTVHELDAHNSRKENEAAPIGQGERNNKQR